MELITRIICASILAIMLTAFSAQAAENPYLDIQISDSEYELLREVVALEAQGEGLHGEELVVETILNRVLSEKWPNTVRDVLNQKYQFSTVRYVGSGKAWAHAGEIEDDAISNVLRRGPSLLPSTKYVYFDTRGRNGSKLLHVGGHYFGAEK